MKQDRFLLGILIFIGLLVIVALALFFVRQEVQTYGTDSTPEGVLRNYVLALQKKDFQRAYGYLAVKKNYPDIVTFRQPFLTRQMDVNSVALRLGATEITGDEAMVEATIIHASAGPFAETWSSTETAILIRQNGVWRISQMPYPFWGWDWYQPPPVPQERIPND